MAELRGPDSTDDMEAVPRAPEPTERYSAYLKLPTLLGLQRPLAPPPVQDELLFIIVHQTHELWFKQILTELSVLVDDIDGGRLEAACRTLARIRQIAALLAEHLEVLETVPADAFERLRGVLGTASGLESEQFRRLELLAAQLPRSARARAPRTETPSASVREAFWRALGARVATLDVEPRVGSDPQRLAQSLTRLLADPANAAQRTLAEALLAFDEQVSIWRRQHLEIGRAPLDEAAPGAAPRLATDRRFFPELWHWGKAEQAPQTTLEPAAP